MATLNHGILTNAGRNLFNSVIKGDSRITYTKVIFCDDKELLNMSDDEIQDLTQINVNNSLKTQPVSYNEGLFQGQNGEQASEVVVRAIVSNAGNTDDSGNVIQPPLTNGFYPYVSALYASDGNNEILYGLYLKDQPGYMPAYDGHTPQPLQFTWRLYASTTDNFNLSDAKDVYATIEDLKNTQSLCQNIHHQLTSDTLDIQKPITKDDNANNIIDKGIYPIQGVIGKAFPDMTKTGTGYWGKLVVDSRGMYLQQYVYDVMNDNIYYRCWNYGSQASKPWERLLTNNDYDNLQSEINTNKSTLSTDTLDIQKPITKDDNANNITDKGIYPIQGVIGKAFPDMTKTGTGYWGKLVVDSRGMYLQQYVYDVMNDNIYYRCWNYGSQASKPWERLLTNSDYDNLQSEINKLPTNNNVTDTAKNAMNQAISVSNSNKDSLQQTINNLPTLKFNGLLDKNNGFRTTNDFNNALNTGIYQCNNISSIKNAPTGLNYNWGILIVINEGAFKMQKVITAYSDVAVRGGDSIWHQWNHLN